MANITDILAKNHREMESLNKRIKKSFTDIHQWPFDSIREAAKINNQSLRSITARNNAVLSSINLNPLFGRHQGQFGLTQEVIKSLRPLTELQKNLQSSMESLRSITARNNAVQSSINLNSLFSRHQWQFDSIRESTKIVNKSLRSITARNNAVQSSINLNSLFSRHQGQFDSIRESTKIVNKSLQPLTELQKNMQFSLEPFRKQQQSFRKMMVDAKLLNNQFPDFLPVIKQIEEYKKHINSTFPPSEIIRRILENLLPSTKESLLLLAKHGWYCDSNMSNDMLWKLKKSILKEDIAEMEDALIEYFVERFEEIGKSLITQFPHRAHIISQALDAHRRGHYYASIPLLLAQTDGIYDEAFDEYFYTKKNGKSKTAQYVKQIDAGDYTTALLILLITDTPIYTNKDDRKEGFDQINRHLVLHGESLDYGTKANSLKVLSLINLVSYCVKYVDRHRKSDIGLH